MATEPKGSAPDETVAENPTDLADRTALERAVANLPSSNGGAATRRRRFGLGLDRFSGLYVWAIIIVIFSIWVPNTFLSRDIPLNIAGDQAVTCMLAFGLIIPLAAGVFDLSIAATMGFVVCVMAWLQHNEHVNPLLACLIGLLVGLGIGVINGIIVVQLNVNSFIGTLGMSSVLAGASYWLTGGLQLIIDSPSKFLDFGSYSIWSIPLPFYLMLLLGLVLYVIIEYTPVGRHLFAVGGNPQAARLAGVRVNRIMFGSLVASSAVAALAGIVLAAKLGIATYDVGPSYLLPAFSAVFLGSTQIKAGRVNVIGTFVGIYLLATGVKGLQLAGAQSYVNDLFNGAALIIAVALSAKSARKN